MFAIYQSTNSFGTSYEPIKPTALEAASGEYAFLTEVLKAIRGSKTIANVLRLCLHFNNFVNQGTTRVYRGLRIASVEKLSRMKGNSSTTASNGGAGAGAAAAYERGDHQQQQQQQMAPPLPPPPPTMKTAVHFLVKLATSTSTNIDVEKELKFKELTAAAAVDVTATDGAVAEAAANLRAATREVEAWQQELAGSKHGGGEGGLAQLVATLDGPCARRLEDARAKRQELRSGMFP